jgi:type IV secretion system protein VirB10
VTLFARLRDEVTPSTPQSVAGERGAALLASGVSLQSRISKLLAMALMLALGIAFLAWYYGHLAARPARARQGAQAQLESRAQAEMALPSLGPIPAPPVPTATADPTPLVISAPVAPTASIPPMTVPAPPVVTGGAPRLTALERRLSGAAFAGSSSSVTAPETAMAASVGADGGGTAAGAAAVVAPRATATSSSTADALPRLLQAEATVATRARVLPTQRLLLPKGAFIDCTLETAIDSTLPGLTTCVTATDTFGADGTVVLLERGTKLIGETRGQVQQGSARVFVLWTEARTPTGVVVALDSPGADELGRSGLSGEVNRHFWQRFGAAILISTINGALQAAVQSSGAGGGTVIYSPTDTQGVMTEVLKDTVNIPPTVTKNNGDRIQVLVARDVDFSSVYELRHAGSRP